MEGNADFSELVSIIVLSIQLFFALKTSFRGHNAYFSPRGTLLREQERIAEWFRVVIPVKFSRPTFPPTNRSGGQVDGTRGTVLHASSYPCSCSSPLPPLSPFPSLTFWFLRFLRHRRRNSFLPSRSILVADSAILNPPRAAVRSAPARISSPQG